jgi:hypothetical protein
MTTTTRRPRRPRTPLTFRIIFQLGDDHYTITPLHEVPAVRKAYRVRKHSDENSVYDVALHHNGHISCECLGFLHYQRPCRHIRCLRAAGMLEEGAGGQPRQPAA